MRLVTGADLAKEISEDFNRAAVTMARNRGKIIQDENGLYDIDHPDTAAWILKQLHNISKKKHHDLDKPKAPKPKAKPKRKTVPKKSVEKKILLKNKEPEIFLSDVEIFISALSSALEDSDISSTSQNKLKKDMIKSAEEIEKEECLKTINPVISNNEHLKDIIFSEFSKYKKLQNFSLPGRNNQKLFFSNEGYNPIIFLLMIIQKKGVISELYMNYYSFGKNGANLLSELLKLKIIETLHFTTSTIREYGSDSKVLDLFKEMTILYPGRVSIKTSVTHCKIFCASTDNNYFTIEGSGNISNSSKNPLTEQYYFENNKDSFNFHKKWMTEYKKLKDKKNSFFQVLSEKKNFIFIDSAKNIKFEKCKQTRIVTSRAIKLESILNEMEKYYGTFKEIDIAISNINLEGVKTIKNYKKTANKINIIFRDNISPESEKILNSIVTISDKKLKIKRAHIHTKIFCFKTEENYLSIVGSGGLNANAHIEHYIIDDSESVYSDLKNWIQETGDF